jgi:hypothetical protein
MIKYLIPTLFLLFAFFNFRKACLFPQLKPLIFGFVHLSLALGLFLTFFFFPSFNKDLPVVRLVITGEKKQEQVEWKTPSSPLQKKSLDVYEVSLETPEGENIGTFFVYGDLVAVRAKVLRWHPFLNFIGFTNLCKIDTISNSYKDVKAFNAGPHIAYEIHERAWHDWIWAFWESFYNLKYTSWLVQAATLESNAFPLVPHTHVLTITDGGLSAEGKSQKAE